MSEFDETALLDVRSEESVERIDRLRDDLRHLQERWDNRLVLEYRPFWEYYFGGHAEILLHGNWHVGPEKYNWAIRIPSSATILEDIGANPGVNVLDAYDRNRRYEIVVFVLIAEAGSGPQMRVCIPARLYLFEDKICKVGEGLLYRRVVGGGSRFSHSFENGKWTFCGA